MFHPRSLCHLLLALECGSLLLLFGIDHRRVNRSSLMMIVMWMSCMMWVESEKSRMQGRELGWDFSGASMQLSYILTGSRKSTLTDAGCRILRWFTRKQGLASARLRLRDGDHTSVSLLDSLLTLYAHWCTAIDGRYTQLRPDTEGMCNCIVACITLCRLE